MTSPMRLRSHAAINDEFGSDIELIHGKLTRRKDQALTV